MIETQGNEVNLRYGIIPESIYQNLMSSDFTIRLDAAQLLSKTILSLPTSERIDVSKTNLTSFFEFTKHFLIDENFGVINCFSDIIEFLLSYLDKNILQECINEAISMLLPPLLDKRNAVRHISSNLVIKYSTVLQSTELIEYLITIFYDQPANSQIEILNIAERILSISGMVIDDDYFGPKLNYLIENSFLIVNANVHSAAVQLLQKIYQTKPEIYKSIPDELKKATEKGIKSRISASRIPRTPTSSLPPINIKNKIGQDQQLPLKPPDTASSRKRTDEFWYRSKPRFAKTAGFIIGKGGYISLNPTSSQQFASTNNIPISKNSFARTPNPVFQPQESYSPPATDEIPSQNDQVHIYDQVYDNIQEHDITINNDQNSEYDNVQEEYNDINDGKEANVNENSNDNELNKENTIDTENSADFNEFDLMPSPRVATENKRKLNKASLININEQTDFGDDEKFKQNDNNTHSKANTDTNPATGNTKIRNFDDTPISVKEPDSVADQFVPTNSQRPRRQFKPRPPSLPPSAPPPLYLSQVDENDNDNNNTTSQPHKAALKIRKFTCPTGGSGASIRAKRNSPSSQKVPSTSKNKPDLHSIVSDLQNTSDWEKQNEALLHITSLVTNSPTFISTNIRLLTFEISPLCSSIRSALSKTALECLTSIASSFGSEMTPFFESIVNDLLTILLSSKGFITRLASTCISTILHNVARKKAVDYLTGDHRKRPGACKATLSMCLEDLVVGDGDGDCDDVSVDVIKAIGSFITDANPEARKHARGALKKIAEKNPNLSSLISNMEIDESGRKALLDAIKK